MLESNPSGKKPIEEIQAPRARKPKLERVSRDVTERRKVEEELRESEASYRELADSITDIFFAMDKDLRYTYWNKASEKLTGISAKDAVGKLIFEIFPDTEDTKRTVAVYREVLRTQQAQSFVNEYQLNGKDFFFEINAYPSKQGLSVFVKDITERKKVEEEIARLAKFPAENPNPVLRVAKDGNIIYANKAGQPLLRQWLRQIGQRLPAKWHQFASEALSSGSPKEVEVEYKCCTLSLAFAPVVDFGYVNIYGLDITERKKAEKALRESERYYRGLVNCSADVVWRVNPEGVLIFVSPSVRALCGFEDEELIGAPFEKFLTEDGAGKAREVLERRKRGEFGKEPIITELAHRRKDGTEFPAEIRSAPIFGANGEVVGIQGITRDITERKWAEEKLRISEQKYRTFFETSHEVVFCKDRDGRYCTLNLNAAIGLGGTCIKDVEGKTDYDLLPKEQADALRKIDKQVMESGKNIEAEEIVRNAEGENRIYLSRKWPTYDDKGKITGISCFAMDITERKQAEEALKKSKDLLEKTFLSLDSAVFILDSKKPPTIIECNPAATGIFGYEKEEMVSKTTGFLHVSPETLLEFQKILYSAIQKEGHLSFSEFQMKRKNGQIFPTEHSVTSLKDDKGNRIGWVSVVRDITERKQAKKTLRESEKRFRQFFENEPEYCYMISPEGVILDVNSAALKALGYKKQELVGKPLKTIYAPESLTKVKQLFPKWQKTGQLKDEEMVIITKEGSRRTVLLSAETVKNEDGRILHSVSVQKDVTERKQAEQKLLEYQAQLKSLASQLSLAEEHERRRIAVELHDQISQSLCISKLKLETLRESASSAKFGKVLDEVCNSLGQTIAGTRSLTFDLSFPILYELGFETAVAEWLAEQIEEKHGIATEFEDDGQPKPLDDDIRILLFRNVRELLINIVKHAHAEKIKVSICKVDGQIQVSVEDDGVGFDPAKVAKTAVRRAEFGLFSIRERLEQIGGHLEIESAPGHGSRITMTAPLKGRKNTERR